VVFWDFGMVFVRGERERRGERRWDIGTLCFSQELRKLSRRLKV